MPTVIIMIVMAITTLLSYLRHASFLPISEGYFRWFGLFNKNYVKVQELSRREEEECGLVFLCTNSW